ncbi:MAG: EamA family transporter, partial [Candidatus Diapherotrites archaeon]
MLWLLLIIGAVFLFSFSNIFDKLLVEKYVKNPLLSVVACNVFFAPVLFLALVLWPPALLDHQSFLLLSLSTFLSLLGGLIYYKIVKSIEISRVIIVLQSAPVFILLLAVLILGERPSFINVFGVFSIVLASILVSKNSKGDGLRSNFWLIAAMCGSFMFAVYFSSLKFLLLKYDAWSIFLWNLLIA